MAKSDVEISDMNRNYKCSSSAFKVSDPYCSADLYNSYFYNYSTLNRPTISLSSCASRFRFSAFSLTRELLSAISLADTLMSEISLVISSAFAELCARFTLISEIPCEDWFTFSAISFVVDDCSSIAAALLRWSTQYH